MKVTIIIDCEDHKQLKVYLSGIRQVLNKHNKEKQGQNGDYEFGSDGMFGSHTIKIQHDNPMIGTDFISDVNQPEPHSEVTGIQMVSFDTSQTGFAKILRKNGYDIKGNIASKHVVNIKTKKATGNKTITHIEMVEPEKETCVHCRGDGSVACDCIGVEIHECQKCKGMGEIKCKPCKGKGFFVIHESPDNPDPFEDLKSSMQDERNRKGKPFDFGAFEEAKYNGTNTNKK